MKKHILSDKESTKSSVTALLNDLKSYILDSIELEKSDPKYAYPFIGMTIGALCIEMIKLLACIASDNESKLEKNARNAYNSIKDSIEMCFPCQQDMAEFFVKDKKLN